jgi:hypothetical protein
MPGIRFGTIRTKSEVAIAAMIVRIVQVVEPSGITPRQAVAAVPIAAMMNLAYMSTF